MPSVAEKRPSMEELCSYFPLTFPIPTPTTHPDLITTDDLHSQENLLRNPTSFQAWWMAIHEMREMAISQQKSQSMSSKVPADILAVLGPLALPSSRLSLQRLTYIYEAALTRFPTSFKLWKSYLDMRLSYVLGNAMAKKRIATNKFLDVKDTLEDAQENLQEWEGTLDPIIGWEEWKSLAATFERALIWIPKLPGLWLMYISIFFHPRCPSVLSYTHAKRTFDRALRTLPPSLHSRIWTQYLLWAERKGGEAMIAVYRRYLSVDSSLTERFVGLLLSAPNSGPRPLEAAKMLLSLSRRAAQGKYSSPEGKGAYELLKEWMKVIQKYPEEVGLDFDEIASKNNSAEDAKEHPSTPALVSRISVTVDGNQTAAYCEDEDPASPRRIDIESIIRTDGIDLYKDQAGPLWIGLATYWIKRGTFDRAKDIFEEGLRTVSTVRDFTQIFDTYLEFGDSLISAARHGLDDEEENTSMTTQGLEENFEALINRRPFLLNDLLIRRNPHDVQEWENQVALWKENDEEVAKTYTKALETIAPNHATANLHRLYINFAKFYETGGTSGHAEADLDTSRSILERATKVKFTNAEDLVEVWCEWSEMELRHDNYDEAIRVMQRATTVPTDTKADYHDKTLSAQVRLFKSLKLWSFYVDLEESIGTVESTKAVYDKILELRIANAQTIVNYAAFLEENDSFEESFKVYERGVELFTFPVSFEIWNIYLVKFVKRYASTKLERARDLFEQALKTCPPNLGKPHFLIYAKLEEDHGLIKRAIAIYERATEVVADEDKFEMFEIYIAKATSHFGFPSARAIYEHALAVLPDRQTAEMCLRFAALERKLGEIDRARAIYAHASQFCDPRTNPGFWSAWNAFEIETGSEDTFREMLRVKRSVQAQFSTEAGYLRAQTSVEF